MVRTVSISGSAEPRFNNSALDVLCVIVQSYIKINFKVSFKNEEYWRGKNETYYY